MSIKKALFFIFSIVLLICLATGHPAHAETGNGKTARGIVTSDTLLAGMVASLLPSDRYVVEAILPPGQCPGHYDVKLSDIEKMKKADLTVSFSGMTFMEKNGSDGGPRLFVAAGGRNWMAPDSYIFGLGVLADGLSRYFPGDRENITRRKEDMTLKVKTVSHSLLEKIRRSERFGKPILASSMQKEVLEWMGFQLAGEYGRQETMSAREVIRLSEAGKNRQVVMVVDNLQSGPETGKAIAETLGVAHIVLTNFPSEGGYLSMLEDNVNAVLAAPDAK